jgi:hypothetical protein
MTQDEKYKTSYKVEFDQPDQRKNKFISTAESVLGKLEEKEAAINQTLWE